MPVGKMLNLLEVLKSRYDFKSDASEFDNLGDLLELI